MEKTINNPILNGSYETSKSLRFDFSSLAPQVAQYDHSAYELKDLQPKLKAIQKKSVLSTVKEKLDGRRLRKAVHDNDIVYVQKLLDEKVDPNGVDSKGRSPLHLASCKGYLECVRLLLASGANPNVVDTVGNNPLHLAVCVGNVPVVTELLDAGCNPRTFDTYGSTPIQLAKSKLSIIQKDDNFTNEAVREEVKKIVVMLKLYIEKSFGVTDDILDSFAQNLTLKTTKQEIEKDLEDLMDTLCNLSIDKAA